MSRKSRKGYYVEGEFIAAGSDADQQFRNDLKGTDAPSRTELKAASDRLQELGEELLTLRADLLAGLQVPEKLRDAIVEAGRITSLGARRRQKQLIGKLMHRLDPSELEAVQAALRVQHSQSARETLLLHRAERWRDDLIGSDAHLEDWLRQFPETDAQQLRALVRQARKDARENPISDRQRRTRIYRQIFLLVRTQLSSSVDTPS